MLVNPYHGIYGQSNGSSMGDQKNENNFIRIVHDFGNKAIEFSDFLNCLSWLFFI